MDMSIGQIFIIICAIIGLIIIWILFGYPIWNVWASKKRGEAALQEAMNEQRIQLAEASARREAASINKDAAITKAEAVAEQVARIGSELTHHDLYLKWQWIKMLEEHPGTTIYVPTEAGLPILEAGRGKGINN